MADIVSNFNYEILTPYGWQDFVGVSKAHKSTIKVCFTDSTYIICTSDHVFIHNNKNIIAGMLLPKHKLGIKSVVSVSVHGVSDVYDPINVSNGNVYYSNGIISHNCTFLGSSGTLIHSGKIAQLAAIPPLYSKDNLDVLEYPIRAQRTEENKIIPGHSYALVADVSRGIGGDYSAFTVIDITSMPYKLVAKYRDNLVSPLLFPDVIHKVARDYNNAFVLIEIKENGQQIADILQNELEYENVLHVTRGHGGQHLTAGFGSRTGVQNGVMTSSQVKRIGCDAFKSMVEENKLLINDVDTISEISTFIQVKNSYAADEGYHDDLVMCLVLFGWMTTNPFFKDLTNTNIREKLYAARMEDINNSLTPFGIIDDGRGSGYQKFQDSAGNSFDLENVKDKMDEIKWMFG